MLNKFNTISTDSLRTDVIMAKRVLWCSEGVTNPENLLTNQEQQAPTNDNLVTVFSTKGGKKAAVLLDFGCEFAGGVQIVARAGTVRSGGSFKIRFGESAAEAMLPFEEKGHNMDHSRCDMDVILPYNSCSRFGKTGYRFLYIEHTDLDSNFTIIAVQGLMTYRDIPYKGTFECNDDLVNRIYDTCAYTAHVCMQENLWDGIKRDRMVWIGDTHPEMLTIRGIFGDVDIVDDCLRVVAQKNPLPSWPHGITTYALWYILILWDWYLYNGRIEIVEELKTYWIGLLKNLLVLVHEGQEEVLIEEEFERGYFLDWPTKGTPDAKSGIYGLFGLALSAAEHLCEVVGEKGLAKQCRHKHEVLNSYDVPLANKKQCVAMMQLAGQIDDKVALEKLSDGLGRGMSTFMSAYILKASKNVSDSTLPLQMLREYYGAMLDAGATTFWEDFDLDWVREGANVDCIPGEGVYDIHGDNGRFCYQQLRHSLCHGWSSGAAAFLAEDVLGIEILEPGCKKMEIHPDLGDLEWAKGTYPTPYGIVSVSVKKDGDNTTVEVDAPTEIEIIKK